MNYCWRLPGKKIFVTMFILVQLILSSFYIDIWLNANTTSRALPVVTYYEQGTFRIDKYHELTCDKSFINGHYYTDKAPLPTLVVLPFFGVLVKTGIINPDSDGNLFGSHIYMLGGFLAGSVPFVIITLVIFFSIISLKPPLSQVILAMGPLYASFLFVFTGSYFAHLFAGLLLLVSYINLKKEKYLLSGVFAGLTFISEYNLAVIFLIWTLLVIYRTGQFKPVVQFALGTLPSILFIGWYNYKFTGSPFELLYKYHTFDQHSNQYGFLLPGIQSVWGLSFSWYRGVFFFAPFLLLLLVPFWRSFIAMKYRFLFNNYLVLPAAIYFLFISSFFAWWGGWTYGPRFLTGVVILIMYEGIRYFSKHNFSKTVFYVILFIGLVCSLLAKITIAYSAPSEEMNPLFNLVIPAAFSGDFNPNNLLTIFFHVPPKYSMVSFLFLFLLGTVSLTWFYARISKHN
jgi:hypothetical protein